MYFHVKMSGELLNVLEADDSTNIRRNDNYSSHPGPRLYRVWLDTLDAHQCTRNVVFTTLDTQHHHKT